MKKTLLLLVLTCFVMSAQEKWSTNKALVSFEASVPLFEPIQAETKTVSCLLNSKKSSIIFVVKVKDFLFKRSLMQQHFNENYLETKKYPKAIFKGNVLKFNWNQINTGQTTYTMEGDITIHGQSKKIRVPTSFKKIGNKLEITTNFSLNTDDFSIDIPFLVRDKIAKNVNVNLAAILE